jgi:3-oxoacyl-(acyl-carrier-protein) synthase III
MPEQLEQREDACGAGKPNGYALLRQMQVYAPPVSRVVSIGVSLPERVVDNDEIARMVDAPALVKQLLPSFIYRITGNRTRRYAPRGTSPSDLAVEAAQQALHRAGLGVRDIDTLIFASTDMDTLEPATANIVQQKLHIRVVNSFDVTNACNSMLQAMNVVNGLIATGSSKRALICSGELGSHVCNYKLGSLDELDTKLGGMTLGDAGAALIMEPSDGRSGLTEINLTNLGEHWELCHVPETTDWRQREGGIIHGWFFLRMSGLANVARDLTRQYFEEYAEFRLRRYAEKELLDSVEHIIPHQISRRFVENLARGINPCAMDQIVITADLYGNTGSTAIPLAMNMIMEQGRTSFGSGHTVLLYGAASGFSIGHIRMVL